KRRGERDMESDEGSVLTTRSAGRLSSLESELASGAPADKQAATTRISRLESRWEELKARLLPKDREITELRQQAEEQRSEIEEQFAENQRLLAALAEARQQAAPADNAAE